MQPQYNLCPPRSAFGASFISRNTYFSARLLRIATRPLCSQESAATSGRRKNGWSVSRADGMVRGARVVRDRENRFRFFDRRGTRRGRSRLWRTRSGRCIFVCLVVSVCVSVVVGLGCSRLLDDMFFHSALGDCSFFFILPRLSSSTVSSRIRCSHLGVAPLSNKVPCHIIAFLTVSRDATDSFPSALAPLKGCSPPNSKLEGYGHSIPGSSFIRGNWLTLGSHTRTQVHLKNTAPDVYLENISSGDALANNHRARG